MRPQIFAFALAGALVLAVSPAAAKKEKAAEPAPAAPALWRIVDEDTTLYLFGVTGLAPEGADWRSRSVARAIDAAETVWFEAPVDEPSEQAKANRFFNEEGMLPKGATLADKLPEEASAALPAIAADAGLDPAILEPLKPWAAFVVLSSRVRPETDEPGVAKSILTEARARGRQLRYFGTVEQSLRVLTDLAPKEQSALAANLVADFARQRAEARAGFEAWRTGDADGADAYFNAALREASPELYAALVTARQDAFAGAIGEILKSPGAQFIALDIAYLVGPDALPERLEAAGLSIERVAD